MVDSETLTLGISLNSSQMRAYFYKDLATVYLAQNLISNHHPFSIITCYYPHFVAMGLTSREIRE